MPSKGIKQHNWSENNMLEAVKAVQSKRMGYLLAAKTFSVPRATLFRYCQILKDDQNLRKQTRKKTNIIARIRAKAG
ncbi:unnamed protein product [Acanthoscelides obtectus]|uniref:HTH psq-type domain-containing protein n=1 Tax=Acanthoscelides obtectus TaxID=200917 RepID=A0A9P0P3A2_ACAOB|nr:unnamed protein product [Acanthoscelides obtectus]CAK1648667.1 hypothetical protein AOBTE_LOCUS15814 [Acanthoscelides obtectus]